MERTKFSAVKNALVPANDEARVIMAKLALGETVDVSVFRERSPRFNNFVHMVCARIGKARGIRMRNVRGYLAAATGRADVVQINGLKVLVPWSTSEMDAVEFRGFWEDAREVIYREILPRLDEADRNAISDMLEAPHAL